MKAKYLKEKVPKEKKYINQQTMGFMYGELELNANSIYNIYGIIKMKNNTIYVLYENNFACFSDAKNFLVIDSTLFHPMYFGHHISQNDVIFVYGSNRMATDIDYLLRLYINEKEAVSEFSEYVDSLSLHLSS
ncbi:MAG: hypothetical protein AB7U79_07785 [Candidatus Izemoplasmatales bacterium]